MFPSSHSVATPCIRAQAAMPVAICPASGWSLRYSAVAAPARASIGAGSCEWYSSGRYMTSK